MGSSGIVPGGKGKRAWDGEGRGMGNRVWDGKEMGRGEGRGGGGRGKGFRVRCEMM